MTKLFIILSLIIASMTLNVKANTTFDFEKECKVDSTIYEQYPQDGYQVPFIDGTKLSISIKASQLNSILVEGNNYFSRCEQDMMEIETADIAKNIFQYTGETNFDQYVGMTLGMCNTVDEGWMIVIGQQEHYLAYMGPYEVVLSLVSLKCN